MEEFWKKINNYEKFYEISNYGNIRSFDRLVKCKYGFRIIKSKILKLRNHTSGYYQALLTDENGSNNYFYIHRLVAEHFVESFDKNLVINHKDGNKKNNYYKNLESCTQDYNIKHAISNGLLDNSGEKCRFSILKKSEVIEIRNLKNILSLEDLSNKFNTTKTTISRIINYKTWKNI